MFTPRPGWPLVAHSRKEDQLMKDEVCRFVVESLRNMNYDVSEVTPDTDLGPAGLDLESLAIAELAIQVEDEFGVHFGDDDTEALALMTLDEFGAEVARRLAAEPAAKAE
jgi:acyl carrier protein